MAACERYPQLQAVVFDLPEAVPLAREIVGASPVANRIQVVAGDFFEDPLPDGDLYTLGRILHDWTEEKIIRLLTRIFGRPLSVPHLEGADEKQWAAVTTTRGEISVPEQPSLPLSSRPT